MPQLITGVTVIGLDLAKHVFQVHGIDDDGCVIVRRPLRRKSVISFFQQLSPCLVGMEACATAHYWARQLKMLGHDVRLMAPSYVKAYVKRGKNDAADAAAICEAVTRPSMRFVPIKTAEQQAALMLHRTRGLLVRQRTQLINAIRGHLAELGLVAAQGREGVQELIKMVADKANDIPRLTLVAIRALVAQLDQLQTEVGDLEKAIHAQHRSSVSSRQLESIPGVGILAATALAATVTDPSAFKSGREFAAWLGLVPRQNSTGGKERLGSISKQGDRYLRRLLVLGSAAVLRHARRKPDKNPWLMQLLARRPAKVAIVALANKIARIAWAVLARGEPYRASACLGGLASEHA
jgi:transposase